jgi:hypothetical protein
MKSQNKMKGIDNQNYLFKGDFGVIETVES